MTGRKIFIVIVGVGIIAALVVIVFREPGISVPREEETALNIGSSSAIQNSDVSVASEESVQPIVSRQTSEAQSQPALPSKKFPDDYTLSTPDQLFSMGGSRGSLRIFNVSINSTGFSPSEIVVNQGDVLQINLQAGSVPIDLNSYELHAYFWAPAGQVQSGSIVLPRSGLFVMSCKNNCAGVNSPTLTLAVLPK